MKQIASLILIMALVSCGVKEENTLLQSEVDSLRTELSVSQQAMAVLNQVSFLMDSIDKTRNVMFLDFETGVSMDDLEGRMKELNDYIKESEQKIKSLESALESSNHKNSSYYSAISRLKKEINDKNKEIQELETVIAELKIENTQLITKVELQEAKLTERDMEILARNEELQMLESRIEELRKQSKMTEAEAYFAKGEAWLTAANRTQLSRKKKQNALISAMESFQRAADLGHEEASGKIEEIKPSIK